MMILEDSLRGDVAVLNAIPDRQARLTAFLGAIRRANGMLHLPIDDTDWGPGMVEVSYRSVWASGSTAEEAMVEWLKCAARVVEAEAAVRTADAPVDDLREACMIVRTRSECDDAIAAARTVERALSLGMH